MTRAGIVTINPASGDELGFYPYTTPQDIDRVLQVAVASRWGRSRVEDRVAAIGRLGEVLAERREPLATLITLEMGKPIGQARAEIDKCVSACRYYAEELPGILRLTTGTDDDELIAIANSSRYGLSSSLWSTDSDHAASVSARIHAGAVFINTISATDPRLPTGGIKASGYGRELGKWGVYELANLQALRIRTTHHQTRRSEGPCVK
ncbi:aldehyde dehydrogenase family protein [Acrocarpospora sp. B8E8]|uniref:aldehyde dehydrogenase family protein n=1 Tax=Acrocarpospora sp. B8E8 TaxID=3153572 RepID=UPI00325CEF96